MACDLDRKVGRTCVLRSPQIPDSFNWTCMHVSYRLSSHDVKLTLDVLVDGLSNITYTLLANDSTIWIPNLDLGSSVSIQLTASRHLVSYADYEYALVTAVAFLPCYVDYGMLLYLTPLHAWNTLPKMSFGLLCCLHLRDLFNLTNMFVPS